MKHYYYDVSDNVWSSWSDSELKNWLVKNGYMKSNQQLNREKMIKLVECVSRPAPFTPHNTNYNLLGTTTPQPPPRSGVPGLTATSATGSSSTATSAPTPKPGVTNLSKPSMTSTPTPLPGPLRTSLGLMRGFVR